VFGKVFIYGGSVITNHQVLTAARCITKEKYYVIKVEDYEIFINNENFKSTGINVYPKYESDALVE